MRENVSFEQCNFSYEAFLGDPKVGLLSEPEWETDVSELKILTKG